MVRMTTTKEMWLSFFIAQLPATLLKLRQDFSSKARWVDDKSSIKYRVYNLLVLFVFSQPSPAVYEHTFPPNSISEMPSGVAFPNKGNFMDSLKDNRLKIGVVFLSVSEVRIKHSK